ncbi:MAG TPA: acetyl-CoA carboxylase biotin carboxyl carrier protein [Gemmatimonadota bacterium]|nr:acetyl-CoA carboxylase biotin carboxyl carrier protein [Gemmatimonadota bacterium]
MNRDELRELIRIVEESDIDELEISRWGRTVRIVKRRHEPRRESTVAAPASAGIPDPAGTEVARPPATPSGPAPEEESKADRHVVESPMVGTFYRAPAPEAPPFVEVGDSVRTGQTLCILEAMKLMNELQSEVNGVVRKVLVENAAPVEYGQPLFEIETR